MQALLYRHFMMLCFEQYVRVNVHDCGRWAAHVPLCQLALLSDSADLASAHAISEQQTRQASYLYLL